MNRKQPPAGIILLVVLSSLTFFSVLLAAYLVFSNQSRQASFAISARNIHRPNVNAIIDDALMTLIRGTSNGQSGFFGEDLLSDLYGRSDAIDITTAAIGSEIGSSGFATFRVTEALSDQKDDVLTGRVVTFRTGTTPHPIDNRSYRVVRSVYDTLTMQHSFVIDIGPEIDPSTVLQNTKVLVNGVPRNAAGIGYDGTNIDDKAVTDFEYAPMLKASVGFTLPAALQPNVLGTNIQKSDIISNPGSDFDESYDAADYNNWFLSYRHTDGSVIPSFHRPSVINYILNGEPDWGAPSTNDAYAHVMASLARGTFRPFPLAQDQLVTTTIAPLVPTSPVMNERFTGGNPSFALRLPLFIKPTGTPLNYTVAQSRLDQLATALIKGPWDVDNDSDGTPDSIWMNLDLPLVTSPEGKLLRPMVAPLIEDMSGRLNVNSHSNDQIAALTTSGLQSDQAAWAGTTAATNLQVFRGLGYGPAEIDLPTAVAATIVTQRSLDPASGNSYPGRAAASADGLDVLRTGWRQPLQTATVGYGRSLDPYGRGGVAIGRSGDLVAAVSGRSATVGVQDESINDPYELDPTGQLDGDSVLTNAELEAILRSNDFDIEALPSRLKNIVSSVPGISRLITTTSKSDNTPPPINFSSDGTFYDSLRSLPAFASLTDAQLKSLIAPEIRLGRRLDVNRRIGNGIDDNGNNIVDEPDEVASEAPFVAAAGSGQDVPTGFVVGTANYTFGETAPTTGRQLLARHLYVLMMVVTRDYLFPVTGTSTLEQDYHARRLAQWAVNVVDYRDPDSIMTRFLYDKNPWDGWDPGVPTNENTVWGVEAPELLLTETLAFHDVAVQDTPTGGKKGTMAPDIDKNTDQFGLPEGSLFIELYCPGSNITDSTVRSYPQELYNSQLLEIGKVVGNSPVWRLAISEPHYDKNISVEGTTPLLGIVNSAPASGRRPSRRRRDSELGEAYSYAEEESELGLTALPNQLKFQRFVLFTDAENTIAGMTSDNTFYLGSVGADNADTTITRGQYVCILPRAATTFGYQSDKITRSNQTIAFDNTDGVQHLPAGVAASPPLFNVVSEFSRPKVFVASTTGGASLNVSVPLIGYDTVANPLPFDNPYDVANALVPKVASSSAEEPFLGTVPEHCSIFLQRLADPTKVWDVITNPYRVVDYMPIDLNVFSGQERTNSLTRIDPADAATEIYKPIFRRRSRQKNGSVRDVSGNLVKKQNALHSYLTEFDLKMDDIFDDYVTEIDTSSDFFSFAPLDGHFYSSLGFLNTTQFAVNPGFDDGFSEPFKTLFPISSTDRNLPRVGFAVHPWFNRDFATPFEVLMVPACSAGRLFEEFSVVPSGDPLVYPTVATSAPQFQGAFRHLLNFFHSNRIASESAGFARLLDYIETLPPYRGEVEFVLPNRITGPELTALMSPPFNYLSSNTRQGTINLNSIAEENVWNGLMNGHMDSTGVQLNFNQFQTSLRGFSAGTPKDVKSTGPYNYLPAKISPYLPTQFAGAFRNVASGGLAPEVRDMTTTQVDWRGRPVNAGLLRGLGTLKTSDPDRGGTAEVTPLFVRKSSEPPVVGDPTSLHMDRNRNPFMRYQTLMRMPNLVSDNSQVFLVRLTLGFFEVDADNTNSLGAEYGEAMGETQRYKAMFIVDRSIPVGFIPGRDLNARDTVVFERYYQ